MSRLFLPFYSQSRFSCIHFHSHFSSSLFQVIADCRLTMRMIETSATTFVDGGMSCLSGRTAVYRTSILKDPEFQDQFQNETWRGKYRLHSGDDKFLTRWLVKNCWKMRMQNHKDCMLYTTFKNNVSVFSATASHPHFLPH